MLQVALYSHDTLGLGHFRRCLKLAWALSDRLPDLRGVFVSGSPWTDAFTLPPGFEVVHLPPVIKVGRQRYAPRGDGLDMPELVFRRTRAIRRLLAEQRPDLFIVDNVPVGMQGEVRAALSNLEMEHPTSILVLRDVLDDPATAAREWQTTGASEAVESLYEEIWCFGDRHDVSALVEHGPLAAVSTPIVTCGHLGWPLSMRRPPRAARPALSSRERHFVLVTAGGGADGGPLIESCARALQHLPTVRCRLVPGPDFPADVEARVRSILPSHAEVERFVPDLDKLLREADLVISMAGYNTVCEILASGCRCLLAPRTYPRSEQLIRARRLADRGRATVLRPEDLEPRRLARCIETSLAAQERFPPEVQPGGWIAAERAARMLSREPRREVV